jgi:putative ABC transport system substrate-binding protein
MRWVAILTIAAMITLVVFVGFNVLYEPENSIKTIGVLLSGEIRYFKLNGLIDGLANKGLVEGIHYNLVVKNAEASMEQMESYGLELASEDMDVLVALGGVEADAIKSGIEQKQLDIPLVLAGVASSVERGLIDNYQNHQSNITGVDNYHAELAGKRLELLTKLMPNIQNVLIVYDPKVTPGAHSMPFVEEAAEMLQLTISKFPVDQSIRLDKDLANVLETEEIDAITYLPSFLLEERFDNLIETASKYNVPVMGVNEYEAEKGAMASYGVSYYHQGAQAAPIVSKILAGQHASQIPVESPDRIELVINMRVANDLGVIISPLGMRFAATIIR